MNELETKQALAKAYAVPELEESSAARIRRRAETQPKPRKAARIWGRVAAAGALCVATGASYPLIDANLFCMALARQLKPSTAYAFTLQFKDAQGHVDPAFDTMKVYVFQNHYAAKDFEGNINLWGPDHVERYVDANERIARRQTVPRDGVEAFFRIPSETCDRLAGLDAHRQLTRLGKSIDYGKLVNSYRLAPDSTGNQIEISLLDSTGQPDVFRQYSYRKNGAVKDIVEMRFDYDSKEAMAEYNRLAHSYDREVDLDKWEALGAEISQTPKLKFNLGRDILTLYRYQTLPSGQLLLLYTFSGYHDGQQGSFVRVRDAAGHEWLPDIINMGNSFKLGGHEPVGEVLAPPTGAHTAPTELFVKRYQWEISSLTGMDEMISSIAYTPETIGRLKPEEVARVPDWVYFNSGRFTWSIFDNVSQFRQMQDALSRKDFAHAARLGEELQRQTKNYFDPFFFSRCQLLVALCLAHHGEGNDYLASRDLDAAENAAKKEPGQPPQFYRDLDRARNIDWTVVPDFGK